MRRKSLAADSSSICPNVVCCLLSVHKNEKLLAFAEYNIKYIICMHDAQIAKLKAMKLTLLIQIYR